MTRARNTVVRAAHGVSAEPLWLSLDFRRSASVRQRFKGENRMPRSCSPCPSRAKLLWQFVGDRGRGAGVGRMSSGGEQADRVAREASRVDREDSGLATWDCRRGRNGRRRIPWRVAPIGVAEIRNSAVGGKCGRRDAPAHHGRVAYETRASRPQRASPTVAARNFPARPSLPLSAIPRVISDDVRSRR